MICLSLLALENRPAFFVLRDEQQQE